MTMARMTELFVIKEADQKVEFRQLSLAQREALELAIQADAAAQNFGTDLYLLSKGTDGKLRAKLDPQSDDPRVWPAANDGVLPVNLVWDKNAVNRETGSRGDWVEER